MKHVFDYSKLRGKIREICSTQEEFAKQLGVSNSTLSLKLNNSAEFDQGEISDSCRILSINVHDVPDYFFTEQVQLSEPFHQEGLAL